MFVTMVIVDKLAGESWLNKPLAADIHNTLGLWKRGMKILCYATKGEITRWNKTQAKFVWLQKNLSQ